MRHRLLLNQRKHAAIFARAEVATAGRLESTDGIYSRRFVHNTDAIVADVGRGRAH